MIPDRLFDLALLYKKTKLWQKLWDSQKFAVRLSDGEIGYCCVMGMMGELNAIAVYPGQSGLDSLRKLHQASPDDDELAQMELRHCQDCLMLSFNRKSDLLPRDADEFAAYCSARGITPRGRNAYPQFERFRPGYVRWYLEDAADQRRMIEGLEAALEVARRLTEEMKTPEMLGLFDIEPFDSVIPLLIREGDGYRWEDHALPPEADVIWPSIAIEDDLTRTRIEKVARKGDWGVQLFRYPQALTDEDENGEIPIEDLAHAPFYPWALMIVDAKTGYIFAVDICRDPEDYVPQFTQKMVEAVSQFGLPNRIRVLDDRTEALFKVFCGQFSVKLEHRKHCKALEEALDNLAEHLLGPDVSDDEFDAMINALRDPEVLASLPDEALLMFFDRTEPGAFPEDVVEALFNEGFRRGLLK